MKDVDFVKGFSFTIGTDIVYFAKLNSANRVYVTWRDSIDSDPRWFAYTVDSVTEFLQDGAWQVLQSNDRLANRYIYQVGFSDGTWRDVSEVTFNEAKTWSSTHATRIIQVI